MNRYLLGLAATLGGLAFLVAACGGGGATTGQGTKTEAKTEAKTDAKAASAPGSGKATGQPIPVGILCDRSGSQAIVQPYLCDGAANWIEMMNNTQGGVKGRPVEVSEVDVKYEVPLAVDAYKKMTSRENIRMMIPVGTPLIDALAPSSKDDKVVLWSPGFGLSDAADGKKYPYIFPGVATYHAQAMAIMQYVSDEWKAEGKSGPAKVVYLYWDNPAGRDPLDLVRNRAKEFNLEIVDAVAVPGTTVDMTTIMLQVKEKNPDYIMAHAFAKMPILMLQAGEKVGFPPNKIIAFVWGSDEDLIKLTGPASEGYRGVQFAAHPNDNPEAYKMLEGYWQSAGKQPNPRARESLYYARGMVMGNFLFESNRLAENPSDGDSLKKGIETMKDFTAYGLLAGTSITPDDHSGSNKVRMYQVKDGKMTMVKDWFEGPKP